MKDDDRVPSAGTVTGKLIRQTVKVRSPALAVESDCPSSYSCAHDVKDVTMVSQSINVGGRGDRQDKLT